AKFEKECILLTGDAFQDVLLDGLTQYAEEESLSHVKIDEFKLPHHGSASNISIDLLNMIQTNRYLISTNGSYYKHPDRTTINLICRTHHEGIPTIVFNYKSETTKLWDDPLKEKELGYKAIYL
ncbi:MAG: hypothetical protein MI892_02805, partial [Desulfobacterales bacterium]|nr:hypothetical protein [Desulfobacterales bacterium]